METKEAIKWIEDKNIIKTGYVLDPELYIYYDKSKEVIDLLKRGEKYEAMYKEIYDKLHNRVNEPDNYNWYVDVMEEVKQKYFPKEADINEAKVD